MDRDLTHYGATSRVESIPVLKNQYPSDGRSQTSRQRQRTSRHPGPDAVIPGADPCPAAVLGELGLRNPATLRHGGGSRDVPPCDHLAGTWPEALGRCL